MKKLTSIATILSMVLCGMSGYSVNAVEETPDGYIGHAEYIYSDGYIIKMKDADINIDFDYFDTDNAKGQYRISSINLTNEKEIGYDGFYNADFSDENFGGYQLSEDKTGLYYILVNKSFDELISNSDIEEVYCVYEVNRNGFIADGVCNPLGGGHQKIFKSDELVKNDANSDGIVDTTDALKVLQATVYLNTFTIKEKIQLDINNCSNFVNYEDYDESLGTEKALEILQQSVGLR